MARSRLLSGASTPVLGKAMATGAGIGSMQYYAADPGAGFVKADGAPFSPTAYPALAAATPRKLGSKFGFINLPGGYVARSIAYGNGTWVVVGSGNLVAYSRDGANWTRTGMPQLVDITCAVWGGGQFVAGAGTPYCYTSPDGITWTYRNIPETQQSILSLAYGNGVYILGKMGGVYLRSTDGVNWVLTDGMPGITGGYNYYTITFANGVFAAVGSASNGGASILWTSPDGVVWTQRSLPTNGLYRKLAFGNGLWILLNQSQNRIFTATNITGPAWTERALPGGTVGGLSSASAGDGLYFLSADQGIWSSTDLVTWTSHSSDMGPNAGKNSLCSFFADSEHVVGAYESTVAFSNYCTPNAAEGTLANGQPAIPYMKAA